MSRRPPSGPYAVRRSTMVLLVAVILGLVVGAVGQLVRMPYVVFSPGPAQDTLGRTGAVDVVSVTGTKTYPTSGKLDFTTVSVYGGPDHPVSLWRYLRAKASRNSVIQPEEEVFGNKTGTQIKQESAAEMSGSQQSAEVVGARAAGAKVGERVFVGSVMAGEPAAGKLQVRDQILRIDGKPASTVVALRKAMAGVRPGSVVPITVQRSGKQQIVRVTPRSEQGRAVLGIVLAPRYTFPFTVKVNAGDVGGPSAGLMFSLAIFDKLTPGALTGGRSFAGTGTISTGGEVGPIGGIRQKMVGARSSGINHFLAPADNCNEVVGHIPDGLAVYKVATFDQARSVVQKVASGQTTGLPTC